MLKIVNATPLIYLAKLGQLQLLRTLYPNIITTVEVQNEVLTPSAPEYEALNNAFQTWIKIITVNDKSILPKFQQSYKLHLGEASIIILALEKNPKNTMLFIDDKAARAVAQSFGINVSGTLGIFIDAILHKQLTKNEAVELIDKLIENTPFRLSIELYKKILLTIKNI